MPVIPLGLQAYNRDNTGLPEVELINLNIGDDGSGSSADDQAKLHLQRLGTVH